MRRTRTRRRERRWRRRGERSVSRGDREWGNGNRESQLNVASRANPSRQITLGERLPTSWDRLKHQIHAIDLGRLIGVDVRGELEYVFVLASAGRSEERVHHRDGAFVVLDHVLQEQPVEVGPAGGVELLELLGRE